MTTSGTALFDLDVVEALEEAYEQAGRPFRSGYDFESARRSLNLVFQEWANIGINLWTLDEGTISLVAGTAEYVLPADTVDIMDAFLRIDAETDHRLTRIGFGTYSAITKKSQQSRPQQFFVERLKTPRLTLWPVPEKAYTLHYWRLRRIQDAGAAHNTLDMPTRFLPALVSSLAVKLAVKNPTMNAERLQVLEAIAAKALDDALGEDRDRSSFYLRVRRRRV